MELNADFNKRAAVHAADTPWVASPMPGVERRMLDRIGGEVARATTIVRYAPGSHFSAHVHTGGEEFLVLDGIFQDEHGDFPAGSYIRNPPQSSHTPGSEAGCTIFVKLWQFDPDDRTQIRIDTTTGTYKADTARLFVQVMPLFRDANEDVCLEQWQANTEIDLNADNGMEILVLAGGFIQAGEAFIPQSWLRLPTGTRTAATAGPSGAQVWIKRHHLRIAPKAPPLR